MSTSRRIVVTVVDPSGSHPLRPIVIAGGLEDCAVDFANAIVVQQGLQGWTATDARTKETRPLDTNPPADIGGWRIAVEQPAVAFLDDVVDLDRSIDDQSAMVEPELRFIDGGAPRSPDAPAPERSIRLPLRDGTSWLIGRSKECDIVLADARVSRRHLRVLVTNGRFEIEDLGSSWGSFDAAGKPLRGKRGLRHGDTIRIGDSTLTLFDPMAQFASLASSNQGRATPATATATPPIARFLRGVRERARLASANYVAWRGRWRSRLKRWTTAVRMPTREVLIACRDGVCAFALVILATWCLIVAVSQLGGS